jgi:endonuclease/exonuclease/phosphatase family metal-dependent hydrolase
VVDTVRAVTWNIQHALRADGDRADPDSLAEVCAGFGADVIALQEVDRRTGRLGGVDLLDVVAAATGLTPIDGFAIEVGEGTYGNALLVRGVAGGVARHGLPRSARRGEKRSLVRCEWEGLTVACCHLDHRGEAATQLGAVLARLDGDFPAVLLGDLNLDPLGVAAVVGAVGPAWTATAVPKAFPADRPRRRIDHVLTRGLRATALPRSPRPPVSDHLPVAVDLAWAAGRPG